MRNKGKHQIQEECFKSSFSPTFVMHTHFNKNLNLDARIPDKHEGKVRNISILAWSKL